ncbi:MAG: zinc-ribbon domain containing protein [Candidatus Paceibacterota bacterium]
MNEEHQDIELVCMCGAPFIWTKGEQKFIGQLLSEGKISSIVTPKRCQPCRQKKKEEREARNNRDSY